jgi:hypothetical protein
MKEVDVLGPALLLNGVFAGASDTAKTVVAGGQCDQNRADNGFHLLTRRRVQRGERTQKQHNAAAWCSGVVLIKTGTTLD